MDEPDGTGRVGGPDAVEGTVGVDDARGVDVEDGCLGADEGDVSDMDIQPAPSRTLFMNYQSIIEKNGVMWNIKGNKSRDLISDSNLRADLSGNLFDINITIIFSPPKCRLIPTVVATLPRLDLHLSVNLALRCGIITHFPTHPTPIPHCTLIFLIRQHWFFTIRSRSMTTINTLHLVKKTSTPPPQSTSRLRFWPRRQKNTPCD